jgi:hypothetical protein
MTHFRPGAALFLAMLSSAAAWADPPTQLTPTAPDMTVHEAQGLFAQGMLLCLYTRHEQGDIASAPANLRGGLQPATAEDRSAVGSRVSADTPVWVFGRLGHAVTIVEPSPQRCEVWATQLPVDRTFQPLIALLQARFPAFKPIALQPGYDPIGYEFESVEGASRLVFHLEGAEPGAPGHLLKVSLLFGAVVRQPASESPPFH